MSVVKSAVKATITQYETLFSRHPGNPILTGKDWPYSINSVFNAGATQLADGSTLLLCRVEDRRGLSHLCAARSVNGVDAWQIDRDPTLLPNPEQFPEEVWGIEDPRITYVPELKKFAVAYTSYSRGGPGVSLALTEDFRSFERLGVVMPPDDKDAALLASQDQRVLGFDPSAHDASWCSRLDLLLSRFATLGKSQTHAGGSPGRLVGCQQDWHVPSSHRNVQRLAHDLSTACEGLLRVPSTGWAWLSSIFKNRISV